MIHHLFTDGSYNPHLNISSVGGYLLDDNKELIFDFSEKLLERDLLKYHELAALKCGLQKCLNYDIQHLVCYSDDISLRNLNYLEVLNKHPIDPIKKSLIKDIIELRQQFPLIEFRHIRRKFNKKADKLAERIQLEHFYDNIFFKERYEIDSQKLLKIPNLICLEDYYTQKYSAQDIEQESKNILQKVENTDLFYLLKIDTIDENNAVANLYSIDKISKKRTFLDFREFDIKKVNSHCLDLLESSFKSIQQESKPSMSLIIESENLALKKFDMLLRRRFIFPKVKTPLADRFLASCDNFSHIVLIDSMPDFLQPNMKKTLH